MDRRRARPGACGLAALSCALILLSPLAAASAAPPQHPIGQFSGDLVAAARQAEQSLAELNALARRGSPPAADVRAAGQRLSASASVARDVLARYRAARVADGTIEEYATLRGLDQNLLEATAVLGRLAGDAPPKPSRAARRAARRQVDDFGPLLRRFVAQELGAAGLEEVLEGPVLRRVRDRVVARLDERAQEFVEGRIRRLTGVGLAIGVPLRDQIRGAGEAYVGRLISNLLVQAGPAAILIRLIAGDRLDPARLVRLVGNALREALRGKGDLAGRTRRTVAGLDELRAQVEALTAQSSLARTRTLLRRAAAAVAATAFLEGDLRRRGRNDLLAQLVAARDGLVQYARGYGALIESTPLRRDLVAAGARAERVRGEAERLLARLGGSGHGNDPTGAVCTPSTFTMEDGSGKQYEVTFSQLRPYSTYEKHCIWVFAGGGEAFLVAVGFAPPGVEGTLPAGDCQHLSSEPTRSDIRHLTVGGGNRVQGIHAVAGDLAVLVGVLRAAESAGVGRACS